MNHLAYFGAGLLFRMCIFGALYALSLIFADMGVVMAAMGLTVMVSETYLIGRGVGQCGGQ